MLFLHNTSTHYRSDPLPDEPYPRLAFDKGITGVPTLCFMDPAGNIVGRPFHSLAACEEMLQLVTRLVVLRARISPVDSDARELFLLELKLDLVPIDQIEARTASWKLTGAEAAVVAAKRADEEAEDAYRAYQAREHNYEDFQARLYGMACSGRIPSSTKATMFWVSNLEYASHLRDSAMAEHAYGVLSMRFEGMDNSWLSLSRPRWREELEAAQAQLRGSGSRR